jgi:hypothetical protein
MQRLTSLWDRLRNGIASLRIPACAEYASQAFLGFDVPGPFGVYSCADVGLGLVGRRQMCRGKVDELEKQVGGWDTHGAGYVLSDVCTSQRRSGARRGLGAVSDDRGGVGDFCFVVCEVEVGGRWRSEQRRADGSEMPRWRQSAIGKITSHVSRCRSAASLRSGFLKSFARANADPSG